MNVYWHKKRNSIASVTQDSSVPKTDKLLELCDGNADLYRILSHIMFLRPESITRTTDDFLNEAEQSEAEGSLVKAVVDYRIIGTICLQKGDVSCVKKYFGKAMSLTNGAHPEYAKIIEYADTAVRVAQKYYGQSVNS